MATSPFVFGTRVSGETFIDRIEETKRLKINFENGINTVLISPRRMGKTSLVAKAVSLLTDDNLRIVQIDAFSCRTQEDFLNAFASAVIKATSSKWEERLKMVGQYLSRLVPKISVGTDPINDIEISLELARSEVHAEDVLNLPQKIAEDKGIKVVVCIDEFQQICEFRESLAFQRQLRSVWQLQTRVSYCLYGSKKHKMNGMFQLQSNPFYRFGDIMNLAKIDRDDWIDYICRRFRDTGKHISPETAGYLADQAECYSSYVQHLAWYVWTEASDAPVTKSDVDDGVGMLINTFKPTYIVQVDGLPAGQIHLLRAVSDGVAKLTSKAVMDQYKLISSAHIARAKEALLGKDLIDTDEDGRLVMTDPLFRRWFRARFARQ